MLHGEGMVGPGTRGVAVAIIGGGVSGLAAAHALGPHAEVDLYEAAPTLGGHVYTVDVPGRRGPIAVDMGFIVWNRENYPHFGRLLRELGVASRPTTMSFSVTLPALDLEWGSASLGALFADRRLLASPRHWRFLAEVLRLLVRAGRDLGGPALRDASLGDYLRTAGVPADVREQFVIPLAAALWSLGPDRCLEFPAESYFRFLDQHGMLRPVRPLRWHTVVGGSRRYVDALVPRLRAQLLTDTPVRVIQRDDRGVTVHSHLGARRYQRVILATHADTALALLDAPSMAERAVLGAFGYSSNHTVLHRDTSWLPRRAAARASWNYVADPDRGRVAVTYWMNRLMGLPEDEPLLVTLGPRRPIAPADVLHEAVFTHPQFDRAALWAQGQIAQLQGQHRTYHAGAHLGFGFHEDGMRSGLVAAARLLADAAADHVPVDGGVALGRA